MKKRKNLITVAIDSPAAAGAGTQAKLIAKHYNLLHLDTGRIYRLIGKMRLKSPKKFNYKFLKEKIKKLRIKDLNDKSLLSDKVAVSASIIAKDKKVRKVIIPREMQRIDEIIIQFRPLIILNILNNS